MNRTKCDHLTSRGGRGCGYKERVYMPEGCGPTLNVWMSCVRWCGGKNIYQKLADINISEVYINYSRRPKLAATGDGTAPQPHGLPTSCIFPWPLSIPALEGGTSTMYLLFWQHLFWLSSFQLHLCDCWWWLILDTIHTQMEACRLEKRNEQVPDRLVSDTLPRAAGIFLLCLNWDFLRDFFVLSDEKDSHYTLLGQLKC